MIQHYQDRQQDFDQQDLLYTLDWLCQELAEEIEDAPDWFPALLQQWDNQRQGQLPLDLQLEEYLGTPAHQNILLYQITVAQVTLLMSHPEYIPLEALPLLPHQRSQPVGLIYSQTIAQVIDQIAQLLDPNWGEEA